MLKSKTVFMFAIALAIGLSACAKKSPTKVAKPSAPTSNGLTATTNVPTVLEGTWTQGCFPLQDGSGNYATDTIKFQYNLMTETYKTYADTACQDLDSSYTYAGLITPANQATNSGTTTLQITFSDNSDANFAGDVDQVTITSTGLSIQDSWFTNETFTGPTN